MRSLIAKLATLPRFRLPPATTAHTRHYMPYNEGKNEKTTKVFDTFIQTAEQAKLLVAWDADLAEPERDALQTITSRLAYFGRAESLVEAHLLDGITGVEADSVPLEEGEALLSGKELVRLLAPMTASKYDVWQAEFTKNALSNFGPKPTAAQKKKLPKVPTDLFDALRADTGELQAVGWNLPPGAQFVNYARPENAFALATKPRARCPGVRPTVARFALSSVVPPVITKALAVAEQIHKVLCSEKISNGHPIFTGVGGKNHQHAHIFCESLGDSNAHITHVTIYSAEGFDHAAVEALRKIQWTWGFKGHDLRTVLHGVGQPDEFDTPLFATAKTWRSLTPFVSTRHAKTYRDGRPKMDDNGWQEGSAPHDLLRLLSLNPRWQGAKIRRHVPERTQPFEFGSRKFRSLQFQTVRHGGNGRRGHGSGAAFEIEFSEPVSGPIAAGYGAHFGLGLFVPIDAQSHE
ncbi:MAG TPA: type I-U CRISPR-associated protein Csb2 [Verrucomicrobiota bacterium]|nr:type I-U CRISPR-associated protein Csb2 [Verrucomicrobiota bacterium]